MSLYGGWLSKYQHLERITHNDVQGLLVSNEARRVALAWFNGTLGKGV